MFESCQLCRKAQGAKSSSLAAGSPLSCMEKKKGQVTRKPTEKPSGKATSSTWDVPELPAGRF